MEINFFLTEITEFMERYKIGHALTQKIVGPYIITL
jgi:hypothetical protein